MKITLKVSLLVSILSFLIAISIGYYTQSIATKALEKDSGEKLLNLAKNSADILDREMLERYREIEFAATLPPLVNKDSSQEEIRNFLEKLKGKHEHHEWIGFAQPNGVVKAGTNGYLEGKNASARPWLPAGLKGPYIGDVHDALLLAKLMPNNSGEAIYFTDVAFPVKTNDGEVLGVLCTHLMWQWTRNIIRSIEKKHGVEIFLVSQDGLILVGPESSERENINTFAPNILNSFSNKNGYKILKWQKGGDFLTSFVISDGFEEYKGFGWRVIVRQSTKNAFDSVNKLSERIIIISIIIGILGLVIGIFIANKITSPLNKLYTKVIDMKNSKEINLEYSNSKDEIGILQNSIIELVKNLKLEKELKNIAEEKVDISLKIFDQSLEGIIITDSENNIILVNQAFTKITGFTQDDVYKKNPSLLSSGKQDKEFYETMWNQILKFGKWDGEVENRRKDGTIYTEHLKISTLKNNLGEIKYYFAVFNSGF